MASFAASFNAAVALKGASETVDGGRLRVEGVDDAGHHFVVGLPLRLAEDVRRGNLGLVFADVGELPDAGGVTNRP